METNLSPQTQGTGVGRIDGQSMLAAIGGLRQQACEQ
jgi:hypothetical protein